MIAPVHAEVHAEVRCALLLPEIWWLLVALVAAVLMMKSISAPVVEEAAALGMDQERGHMGNRPALC